MSRANLGRIHKRPFVVGAIVLLSFIIIGAFLVSYLGYFSRVGDLDRVRVGTEETGTQVQGLSLSLDHIPSANYIANSSFENIRIDHMFMVQSSYENYAFLMTESDQDKIFEDGAFNGGRIRIVALDEDGRFYQKLNSEVQSFEVNQLSLWREIENIPDNIGETIRFINASENQIVGFGDDGYVVVGVGTADTFSIQMDVDGYCVSSDYSDGRFSAVYSDGTIITSSDGRNFYAFQEESEKAEENLLYNTVSSLENIVVAAGDDGYINVLAEGKRHEILPVSHANIYATAGDGNTVLLAGEKGELIATSNGTVFRMLSLDERPSHELDFDWVSASYREGYFIIVGEGGQLATGRYDTTERKFDFEMKIDSEALSESYQVKDVMMDASGEIIMLDYSGQIYIFDQSMKNWQILSSEHTGDVVSMHSAPDRKIAFLTESSVFTSSLLIRVQFDEHLSDIDLSTGDMCYLSHQVPTFESNQESSSGGHWDVYGQDTSIASISDAPASGADMSLRISGQTGDPQSAHFISQNISRDGQILFDENVFYRIDLYLKHSGLESGEVMVWLSGDFEPVGTTFSDVGTGWRRYSFRLVMPREACGLDTGEIRFNVGFYGDGEVFVDNIFLGRDTHYSDVIAEQFSDQIKSVSPEFIRFPSLTIGEQGISSEAFFSIPGNERLRFVQPGRADATGVISIESALRLSKSADAYPWLVVGSSACQEQIDMLMSYLCGSISDPIAKIRIDNGTAVPWSTQFDRIVLEISDSDSIFVSDVQRGAYVNYVMELLEASPYYLDIKDKIIFVDAMSYDGGVMLSDADYHASALSADHVVRDFSEEIHESINSIISEAYLDYYDGIPRVPSRPIDTGGQWINSSYIYFRGYDDENTEFDLVPYPLNAATIVHFLLSDYGRHTTMLCYDVQVSDNPYDLATDQLFSDNYLMDFQKRQTQSHNNAVVLRVMNVLNNNLKGVPANAFITPSLSDVSERVRVGDDYVDSNYYEGLVVYAFRDAEDIHITTINISDQPRTFVIETDYFSREIEISKYAEDATLLGTTSTRRSNARYVLLPGQFLITSGAVDESVFSE